MAKTVWILGAGASAGFGAPVMAGFIDKADDLRSSRPDGLDSAAFDVFFRARQGPLQQLHAKTVVDTEDVESIFGLVEMASLLNKLPGLDGGEIEELRSATRTVLVQTVEQLGTFELRGQQLLPPRSYAGLVAGYQQAVTRGQSEGHAFITFNYDVGLDFAIRWFGLDIDYGLVKPAARGVPLLKLHGSVNWRECTQCHAIVPLEVLNMLKTRPGAASAPASQVAFPAGPHLRTMSPHCPGDVLSPTAAIVPPSWNKTQYARTFSSVWARAAKELSEAREIIVAGYSMPESDSFFRDLLALSVAGPTRIRELHVVNPMQDIGERIMKLLGPELRNRFRPSVGNFENFVQQRYGDLLREKGF